MLTIHEYMNKHLKKRFIVRIKRKNSGQLFAYNKEINMRAKDDKSHFGINLIHSVNQKRSKSDII